MFDHLENVFHQYHSRLFELSSSLKFEDEKVPSGRPRLDYRSMMYAFCVGNFAKKYSCQETKGVLNKRFLHKVADWL